jgi:glycosyltransferase involved in cell wall biosynthesis
MKILLVNTSEQTGGAAIAANRLMRALMRAGVRASMLVRDRQSRKLSVANVPQTWRLPLKFLWERVVILLNNGLRRSTMWLMDIANVGTDITRMPEFRQADVVHLHWVNQGFLSLSDLDRVLRSGKRVVLTMHDMWYFTGVCHYAGLCRKYETECARCPMLARVPGMGDLARRVFRRKLSIYAQNPNLTFVGCSQWMTDLCAASAIGSRHRVVHIPNAIDTETFCPTSSAEARRHFGLPEDRRLILFGAQRITDVRKGFAYLEQACHHLLAADASLQSRLGIVVVGGDSDKVAGRLPLPVYSVPYISKEDDMVRLYNAVDAYVTPSLQDNLPNTIMEAMACGTPCVGFRVGGIPEMIDHEVNGYVANPQDAADFARGICWTLADERHPALAAAARAKAERCYAQSVVAQQYRAIYES